MPDFWSHQFAAKSIRKTLTDELGTTYNIRTHSLALFYLGAQGPDIFYYINKFTPYKNRSYKKIGDAIHNSDPRTLMRLMLETASTQQSEWTTAYLHGFITHYFLDAYCHPHICKMGPDSESHKRVEMDLEALCIKNYWKASSIDLKKQFFSVSDEHIERTLEPFWNTILMSLDLEPIPTADYKSGVHDLHRIEKLLVYKIIDYLPFKRFIGKVFNYNLSLLQYPKLTEQLATQLEYNTFIAQYELAMKQSKEALSELTSLEDSTECILEYVSKWFNKNFLGEDLKDVQ